MAFRFLEPITAPVPPLAAALPVLPSIFIPAIFTRFSPAGPMLAIFTFFPYFSFNISFTS